MRIRKLNDLFLFYLRVIDIDGLRCLEDLGFEFATLVPADALILTSFQFSQTYGSNIHIFRVFAPQLNLEQIVRRGLPVLILTQLGILLTFLPLIHLDILQTCADKYLIFMFLNHRTKFIINPRWRCGLHFLDYPKFIEIRILAISDCVATV